MYSHVLVSYLWASTVHQVLSAKIECVLALCILIIVNTMICDASFFQIASLLYDTGSLTHKFAIYMGLLFSSICRSGIQCMCPLHIRTEYCREVSKVYETVADGQRTADICETVSSGQLI